MELSTRKKNDVQLKRLRKKKKKKELGMEIELRRRGYMI